MAGRGQGEKGHEGKREKKPSQRSAQGGNGSFWDRSGVGTAEEECGGRRLMREEGLEQA